MASSNSPCAACKFLRRKCQPECVFAPYFPPDQPHKFANVHRIFGASNVSKLLNDLHPYQREDAVNSLAYEAEMRLRDPVNGCVGIISLLHHQLRQLQMDLFCAKSELSRIQNIGMVNTGHGLIAATATTANQHTMINISSGGHHHQHQHQFFPRDQYQQQQHVVRNFDSGNYYEANVLAMNISTSFGQLNQIQQPSAAAAGDDHHTVHPS
ncbi:Lateral organ boundary [Sesbania bispinosa]|nr:Lateral organ boundary [Sesbania bispinosa]